MKPIWSRIATFIAGIAVALSVVFVIHPDPFHPGHARPELLRIFLSHKESFFRTAQILSRVDSDERESVINVPSELDGIRVWSIEKKGDFVLFYFRPYWPDDATQIMAFDRVGGSAAVRRLLDICGSRDIYHVQHVEGDWYFASFN
jgi:hypothetical protein